MKCFVAFFVFFCGVSAMEMENLIKKGANTALESPITPLQVKAGAVGAKG